MAKIGINDNASQSTPMKVTRKGRIGFRYNTRASDEVISTEMRRIIVKRDTSIVRKIMTETGEGEDIARNLAVKLNHVKPELRPVVSAWKNGLKPKFEFKGITLSEIMAKENASFVEAILSMDILMKNAKFATHYKDFDFGIR